MSELSDILERVRALLKLFELTLGAPALKRLGNGKHLNELSERASSLIARIQLAIMLESLPKTVRTELLSLFIAVNSTVAFLKMHSRRSRLWRMLCTALTVPRHLERLSLELVRATESLATIQSLADLFARAQSGRDSPLIAAPTARPEEPNSGAVSHNDDFLFPFMFDGRPAQITASTMHAFAQGSSGRVIHAVIQANNTTENVVLKVLHYATTPDERELLRREVEIWSKLNHPCILPYYGTCHIGLGQPALVSPYMEHGNMISYLTLNKDADRLALVQQVAMGLEYLHDSARIVHGDLKCENVLINKNGLALLSDFGLSTFVDAGPNVTATEIRMRNTVRFAAPELLLDAANDEGSPQSRSKTTASDVYAFGMLVYQAYTGLPPWRHATQMALHLKIVNSDLPERPEDVPLFTDTLWEICEQCWGLEPHARPRIRRVRECLHMEDDRRSTSPPDTGVDGGEEPVQDDAVR